MTPEDRTRALRQAAWATGMRGGIQAGFVPPEHFLLATLDIIDDLVDIVREDESDIRALTSQYAAGIERAETETARLRDACEDILRTDSAYADPAAIRARLWAALISVEPEAEP